MTSKLHTPPGGTDDDGLLARIVGEGESPAWWGIPLGRLRGCQIRLHVVTPIYALGTVAHAVFNGLGLPYVLLGLAALAAVVAVHEAVRGHALVRWSGLHPVDVTFWPLGAVWRFHEEDTGRAEGRAALLGLVAAGCSAAVFAGVVVAFAPGGTQLLLDVFWPAYALASLQGSSTPHTLALVAAWQAYAMGVYMVLANLVPMLPLDAAMALRGRPARRGPRDRVAALGLATGAGLVVVGMVTGLTALALLGMCGVVVCWFEWQSARFAVDPAGVDRWRAALDEPPGPRGTPEGEGPISTDDREQVERVLAKISAQGIGSLTRSERRLLHEATQRLRGG